MNPVWQIVIRVVLAGLAPDAGPPCLSAPAPVPAPVACVAAPCADEALVRELLVVLKETKSQDTFCMTVQILGTMKADGRLVVPAIIRNAERLKITEGMLRPESEWTTQQEIVARGLQFFIAGKETPGVTDRWGGAPPPPPPHLRPHAAPAPGVLRAPATVY
jgi:hypothetical protein